MADGFEIRITGERQFGAALAKFEQAIVEELKTAATVWARQTRDLAKRNLDEVTAVHGSSGTPLRGTIQGRGKIEGKEAVGRVTVGAAHGLVKEKGRRAALIPIAPLIRWAQRGGAALIGEKDPVRAAYKVSRAARKKRRPGRPFLQPAVESEEIKALARRLLAEAWAKASRAAGSFDVTP